ncbi:MAG: hypothetical protein FWH18_02040 [Marinilabiliaceae bacterium]|nr:hypothetical protein [Marinilabiliaceae bacterium]
MGIYKSISKVIGIYISVFFLLSCSGNTNKYDDLKRQLEDLQRENEELAEVASDLQAFVEKSSQQSQTINEITNRLADISEKMYPLRYSAEIGSLKMKQVDQINFLLSEIEKDLQKARSGEFNNEQLAIIKNLQSIVKSQQREITILRTVNNAWVAFNANDYSKAYSLFLSSDESSKREGARAFQNKALQLIAARNGECDNTAKSFLLKAKELNNTQEIRDLINRYK